MSPGDAQCHLPRPSLEHLTVSPTLLYWQSLLSRRVRHFARSPSRCPVSPSLDPPALPISSFLLSISLSRPALHTAAHLERSPVRVLNQQFPPTHTPISSPTCAHRRPTSLTDHEGCHLLHEAVPSSAVSVPAPGWRRSALNQACSSQKHQRSTRGGARQRGCCDVRDVTGS